MESYGEKLSRKGTIHLNNKIREILEKYGKKYYQRITHIQGGTVG
jgi:hypothetical protein